MVSPLGDDAIDLLEGFTPSGGEAIEHIWAGFEDVACARDVGDGLADERVEIGGVVAAEKRPDRCQVATRVRRLLVASNGDGQLAAPAEDGHIAGARVMADGPPPAPLLNDAGLDDVATQAL